MTSSVELIFELVTRKFDDHYQTAAWDLFPGVLPRVDGITKSYWGGCQYLTIRQGECIVAITRHDSESVPGSFHLSRDIGIRIRPELSINRGGPAESKVTFPIGEIDKDSFSANLDQIERILQSI